MSEIQEPTRISSVYYDALQDRSQVNRVKVNGAAKEVATGSPNPMQVTPAFRLSSIYSDALQPLSDNYVRISGGAVEMAHHLSSDMAPSKIFGGCMEVADGNPPPMMNLTHYRTSSINFEACLSLKENNNCIHGAALEIAHKEYIYSRYSNVQLIY